MGALEFLRKLGQYKRVIPRNTLLTLKGQALNGDLDGAQKGLDRIIKNLEAKDGTGD